MRHRSAVIAVACTAVLATSGVAGAERPTSRAPARAPASEAQDSGGEYVVAFDTSSQDAALAAIADAGGVVVDVQEQIGLALVETTAADFTTEVAADASVTGVVQNQSIGASELGRAPVRATERLTVMERGAASGQQRAATSRRAGAEPLESLQWDMAMIGATADGAHRRATGRRVTVGIIDTGVDASHPDIAPNFSYELSRNFTHDIPAIDGPCDVPTCIDPAWVDEGGHGTHVAGTVGAARNGIGTTGVAPDATIVNVRAGQDSGFFFFYETVSALLYAADAGLDVVNMSFFTDPWLFNCESEDDYISGDVTPEQIAEQAMIRTGGHRRPRVRPRARRHDGGRSRQQPPEPRPARAPRHHQSGLPGRHRAASRGHEQLPRPPRRRTARAHGRCCRTVDDQGRLLELRPRGRSRCRRRVGGSATSSGRRAS